MSRVLVTGIEGFVGRHLARLLASEKHELVGIHFAGPPGDIPAELHEGDIRDFEWLKSLLAKTRPDRVVHLAALSSVAESETRVMDTFRVNASGTLNLLEAVRLAGCGSRILLVSSAAVYGRAGSEGTLCENTPSRPVNAYGLSKLAAEQAGLFSHRAFGTDVVVVRPFSHTGPGQGPSFVFPTVAKRIVEIERASERGEVLDESARTIELGNLEVKPDYSDVRDIARAYALALERCAAGEVYNVTSGNSVLLREGIASLCSMARTEVRFTSVKSRCRDRDIPVLHGDASKFEQATGWKPQVPFQTTLSDLLDWYRSAP